MLISRAVADGIAAGTVTVLYRRWARPRVRAGSRLTTGAGVVEFTAVDPVDPSSVTEADAARAGAGSVAEVLGAPARPDGVLYAIGVRWAGPDPRIALSEADDLPAAEVEEIRKRLSTMDKRGPWTRATLELIAASPGRRAADLAEVLGRDKIKLKTDIRKLKGMGLTLSLETGYRISPRGAAFLRALGQDS